jgi:cytoskeleton protein RodZ
MSQDTVQDSLFQDPIGLRFRAARERLRWTIETAAQQLKLPKDVLEAIEREDWARLGPAIYARSYITSYARLLGLPVALADEAVAGRQQPDLVSNIGSVARPRRLPSRGARAGRPLVVVVVLLALLAAAWALGLPDVVRHALAGMTGSGGSGGAPTAAAPTPAPAAPAPMQTLPMPSASASAAPAVAAGDIVLRFRGDSWVEVLGTDGAAVERGLLGAGAERRFSPGQVRQVTLGDATVVDVSRDGVALDLGPANATKAARFTVSSDGSIHPSAID